MKENDSLKESMAEFINEMLDISNDPTFIDSLPKELEKRIFDAREKLFTSIMMLIDWNHISGQDLELIYAKECITDKEIKQNISDCEACVRMGRMTYEELEKEVYKYKRLNGLCVIPYFVLYAVPYDTILYSTSGERQKGTIGIKISEELRTKGGIYSDWGFHKEVTPGIEIFGSK